MSLREALEAGRFAVTSEVGPPKGIDVSAMMASAELLRGRVDALNVTDNQAAVMRLSTIAACVHLKQAGFEPVLQVTGRDRNRLAIQSDLLGAASLGITTVLALTGDHVVVGDHREAKAVFDLESVQILKVIADLNAGHDMTGHDLIGTPEFYPGAVVTPGSVPLEPQIAKFEKKIAAGARYFQTQAVFDIEAFAHFMSGARESGAKVLAGVVVLRSARMAHFMNKNIPGIAVPDGIIATLERSENPQQTGIEIAARFIDECKEVCDGVHIMAVGAEHLVPQILDAAGLTEVIA
ncbi:MAG: 5,10-methylenetetrahydrofolate reductase [Actinobacteria bacterium HGW-Actinobacteria-7]|nr:MAG: 5,10-methylenetetrahydrofolate reductase [Actinobacteria bacterium HGW-Actinobacteria-7]